MKLCTRCEIERHRSEFRKKTAAPDGLSGWCKPCYAIYERERYQNGDRPRKDRNKAIRRVANRNNLIEFLLAHPCVDCGEYNPIVLEFDHRDPSTKKKNVCEMLDYSWKTIQSEIDKCDVRCANCHRIRTHKQFGFWK